ncbi:equilibrative nucleotide transporter 7-like [Dendronephthya gigantea]|uniref:equilibrative nucleotide transporter 7-like n=1 Tax=Dendronephthya gigantea TaxID=151771 RepID=UPI00106DC718|nr:equilibrative nucleotide transporter 7-like [Dendronephthya gigantea]
MASRIKLYIACWFIGASVQSAVFLSFNAVDYFNYFFSDYKPEVYISVTAGVAASAGAILTVLFPPRGKHFTVLFLTLIISAILLVVEVVLTPLEEISTQLRFGLILAVIFLAAITQNFGGGALYDFVGKHFPTFGVQAAQSGGVCAFAATFVIRCVSKGSFEHLQNKRRGFRLSGYLYVALVDLIIVIACFCVAILVKYSKNEDARRLAAVNQQRESSDEQTPLLSSTEAIRNLSRRQIIKNNLPGLATIALSLVITNSLFPGITSQFHGNHNCSTLNHHTNYSSVSPTSHLSTTPDHGSDKTGWFVVILFGCFSFGDAIGKNLPILGIIYNKRTVIFNCLIQLLIAIPILLIYFKPCVSGLQADWVAYFTLGVMGVVNGYGLCAAMMLLAPGVPGKKYEEGLASSIGFMFLQSGILLGTGISVFLVDYVFEVTNH